MSVAIKPGATALTRMPRGPSAAASDAVTDANPAFAAEYEGVKMPDVASTVPAAALVTFTIAPPSASTSSRRCVSRNGADRFTSRTRPHSASSTSGNAVRGLMPAAWTMPCSVVAADRTARSAASRSDTSSTTAVPRVRRAVAVRAPLVDVGAEHVRAESRELVGGGTADAAAGAGDEDLPSVHPPMVGSQAQ